MNIITRMKIFAVNTVLNSKVAKNYIRKHRCEYKNLLYSPKDKYPILYHVKDDTYETIYRSETFKLCKRAEWEAYSPAIDILEIRNAKISMRSDVVIDGDWVIWDKLDSPLFSITVPCDSNVFGYDEEKIIIRKYPETVQVQGNCVSLLGTFSELWSHFLLQFVSKLYFAAQAGLLTSNTTVIIPENEDDHVRKIVHDYLAPYGCRILEAHANTYYECEKLCYIPTAMQYPNHAYFIMPEEAVVSTVVKEALHNVVIDPYIEDVIEDERYRKIYVARRSNIRGMVNWQEAEDYFTSQGFVVVEPHKMPFEEKVRCFRSANIIVGPGSSGFFGTIWSKPNTKILNISNFPRTIETTGEEWAAINGSKMLFVTGYDLEKNSPHASYRVPLSRVQEAYQYLLRAES